MIASMDMKILLQGFHRSNSARSVTSPSVWVLGALVVLLIGPNAFAQKVLTDLRDSHLFTVVGGDPSTAEQLALSECKKSSKYVHRVVLESENKRLLLPNERSYRCSFLETDQEGVRPGSVEQRLIQTRRFKKSSAEVKKAIGNWAEDSGFQGGQYFRIAPENFPGSLIQQLPIAEPSYDRKFLILKVDVTAREEGVTDVRIRTSIRSPRGETEFFVKRPYQSIFNEIAQQLFVDAIELEPSEIQ